MFSRWIWTALTIVSMWVAVLFTGIWAPSVEAQSSNGDTFSVPASVAVAFFAAIATIVVAAIGFRGETPAKRTTAAEETQETQEVPTLSPTS
jgi:hypothetical protein